VAQQKVRKAVIAAAGFGTRFLPQTKAMPKEMLPIIDKPVIQVVVEELVAAGIEDIVIVTGYHKRSIEDHFDSPSADLIENLKLGGEKKKPLLDQVVAVSEMANFIYIRQKGPYGNGTPLMNARDIIGDEPFIFTWSDDFIVANPGRFAQLISLYETHGAPVLSCIRAQKDEYYERYGFASGEELVPGVIKIEALLEKPGKDAAPSDLATVSGGLFTPEIFVYLEQASAQLGEGKELYYNDALKLMAADGKTVLAAEIQDAVYYDAGDKLEYLKTVIDFGLSNPQLGGPLKDFLRSRL
jgi:UTP--glucose-1-phosphate uridylyltransferase